MLSRREFGRKVGLGIIGVALPFMKMRSAAIVAAALKPSEHLLREEENANASEESKRNQLLCLPVIRGHLRGYDHPFSIKEGIAGWRRELETEQRIGATFVWLSHIRPGLDEKERDTVKEIFDACEEQKMGVIIETGHTPQWFVHCDCKRELEEVRIVCRMISERYGDHPAFYGWYLHHEIYVADTAVDNFIQEFFPAAVETCKKAVPEKPVTLSPFFILDKHCVFGNFRYVEPDEYRMYWTGLIRRSGFDIIMLQDSGEHFSWVTIEQRRPFFEAMYGACRDSNSVLWGNVETAEMVVDSIEQYIERCGRVHHSMAKGIPWRNVPIDRLEQKLRLAAEYCDNIVSWGYWQFGRPHLSAEAAQWYEDYRQYYERVISTSNLTI